MKAFNNTLIQIAQNGMGNGDEQLALQLVANYLKLLNEEDELPKFIVLYNGGVKLACTGSPAIEAMQVLEKRGIKIIACTTCLKYFGLLDNMEVGIAGTMMDIIELQKSAEKVVNL